VYRGAIQNFGSSLTGSRKIHFNNQAVILKKQAPNPRNFRMWGITIISQPDNATHSKTF
jgi:hypothetical protein